MKIGMNELLIRIDERVMDISTDIKDIKETLHGDGKEGLCATVLTHTNEIRGMKESNKKTIKILGIILGTAMFVIALLNYFKI